MNQINHQIEIEWPVTALFNYVSDITNNAEWQNDVIKSEWIRKTDKRIGSTFCDIRTLSGCEVSSTMKVTEFIPDKKRTVTLLGEKHLSFSVHFVPLSDEHTRLMIELEWNEKIDADLSSSFCNDMNRLKNILETIYC